MKRWITHLVIVGYLGLLAFGIGSHAIRYGDTFHPGMYFIVWDMFCGWSTWETRAHVLGQGASGTYYELGLGPWGDYQPYSNLSRLQYDTFGNHAIRIGVNTLRHTQHEPIERIYVVEESWNKKFNLPESVANHLCPRPQEKRTYVLLRDIFTADGTAIRRGLGWHAALHQRNVAENERLAAQQRTSSATYLMDQAAAAGPTRVLADATTPFE